MSIYAVVLPAEYDQPDEALKEHFEDDQIKLWDRAFLVSSKKTTEDIAKKLQITSGINRGLVIRLDFYTGTAAAVVREWLSQKQTQ
jgi:hypothetical protein